MQRMEGERRGRSPLRGRWVAAAAALLLFPALAATEARACRFWGVVGGRYPHELLTDHLRDGSVTNLKELGGMNRDGWGFGFYMRRATALATTGPFYWRGGAPANHTGDPSYDRAVDDLARMRPRVLIGHVRAGTSGHWGIPNPHPFEHEGILFAHNGVISEEMLRGLLTADDTNYLYRHPPDYVNGHIDSELYFLYILKMLHAQPGRSVADAILLAVRDIENASPGCRLNFVLATGDTLYALRYAPYDQSDPVRFYPANVENSFFWIAASTVMGSDPEGWGTIPPRTLAIFAARRTPVFLPVNGPLKDESDALVEQARIGVARPNPSHGPVVIEAFVPAEGDEVALVVYDPQGRRIWSEGPRWTAPGQAQIHWEGRDGEGRRVASGSYFLDLKVGDVERRQRITILR